MMGQVRRTKQPGPAAVKVVELPRPRPKEGEGGEQAYVHAIAEEKRPKAKTGQAKPRGGKAKEEATGAGDMSALLRQVEELTGQVRDLKVQRISTDREIKLQRAWVEGELEQRAAVVHVRNRMGALEVGLAVQVQRAEERMGALEAGLAAQVQRAEESRSQIESQRLWVEGKCEGLGTVEGQPLWRVQMEGSIAKLNADAERLHQRGRTAGERLQQVAAGVDESTKTLLEKGGKLQRRLHNVEERPDMTERLESVERSVQVCVNSVRVLHSYAEANGSSDSDG
jgi:hypothetical protein